MVTVKDKYGFVPTSVLYFVKNSQQTLGFLGNQELRKNSVDNSSSFSMSEFSPPLAEFIIKYWSNEGDLILDPFHGWGTRCFEAIRIKRNYIGYDISPVTSNDVRKHLEEFKKKMLAGGIGNAELMCGDGIKIEGVVKNSVDMIFTCPPYFNIEKYESINGQLSDFNDYQAFLCKLHEGAKNYYNVLKNGKFCVFVVGDWREEGQLRLFGKDVIDVFCQAGFILYDFLINKLNSAAVVGCGNFDESNFVTKSHEYVLVFKKDLNMKSNYEIMDYNNILERKKVMVEVIKELIYKDEMLKPGICMLLPEWQAKIFIESGTGRLKK
jgi:DNA modification methylase